MDNYNLFSCSSVAPYLFSLAISASIVIASVIPLAMARYFTDFHPSKFLAPRALSDSFSMWGRRAEWAHQNCFESFSLHAPATLIAVLATINGRCLDQICIFAALFHPLLRLFYIGSYLSNRAFLRAFFWGGGLGCTGVLYFQATHVLIR